MKLIICITDEKGGGGKIAISYIYFDLGRFVSDPNCLKEYCTKILQAHVQVHCENLPAPN